MNDAAVLLSNNFFFFCFLTLNTPEEKKISTTLSALMINIVTLFFSRYFVIIIIIICSIQIAIIYMYNAGAVPCRAVCIATTVIIRVRAIDICSSERVYVSRDTSSSRGLTSRSSGNSHVSPDGD